MGVFLAATRLGGEGVASLTGDAGIELDIGEVYSSSGEGDLLDDRDGMGLADRLQGVRDSELTGSSCTTISSESPLGVLGFLPHEPPLSRLGNTVMVFDECHMDDVGVVNGRGICLRAASFRLPFRLLPGPMVPLNVRLMLLGETTVINL